MKEKRDCKIVQDLLPNYIEKLTNEETNAYIDEHISSCKDCQKVLQDMKNNIKIDEPKNNKKEVKFLKKYNRKIRILSSIVIAIIVIYLIIVVRNVVILSKLTKKTDIIWNPNNMHTTTYNYSGNKISIVECYYKDERRLTEITTVSKNEKFKFTEYTDKESNVIYIENGENKIAYVNPAQLSVMITPHLYFESPFELMFRAATSLITRTNCNGEDCYFINTWGMKEYYSSKTGLAVRNISVRSTTQDGTYDNVVDYKYEFGTVRDEDLTSPDISEYKIIANENMLFE